MDWYALSTLDNALDETRSLLTPVQVGVWLRLAVVAVFAGGATGTRNVSVFVEAVPTWGVRDALETAPRLAVLVAIALALFVVLGFVGSVMEFVLVSALRTRTVGLRGQFAAALAPGLRLFGFRAALGALALVPVSAVVALIVVALGTESVALAVVAVVLVPVAGVLALAAFVASAATTSFVVPLMQDGDLGVLDGWRAFWPTLRGELRQFVAYAAVRFGLSVLAGVLTSIVAGAFAVPVALAFAGLALTGVATAVLVAVGALALLLALALLVAVQVPVTTYLRYHSLLVLDASDAEFRLR
ncbi:DUF7544 domain-containing protein [Salarchaeum japonicum]|uniref:Glycerophosphoryl diester phosphodiesterase membrane domain-containing protein n=1 Tax=Salarchaeum japonicum TaxID=555573 RepID=A0AAV3T3F0_9EURY|nr:hypothetical protein [Salarchaeum japonicum]